MKEEALKLADELESKANEILDDLFKSGGEAGSFLWNIKVGVVEEKKEASAMIRRLVEELDCAESFIKQYQLEQKPLSEDVVHNIYTHIAGKAEGLVEAGLKADFPTMFADALLEYTRHKPRTKPLSDEEINNIVWQQKLLMGNDDLRNFVRAIEERHGIK